MYKSSFFEMLFSPLANASAPSVNVKHRILNSWESGYLFILNKEMYRWGTYFFRSNVAPLLVLLFGILLFIKHSFLSFSKGKKALSLLLTILTGFFLLAVLDPHPSTSHSIPLIPFFFLLLAQAIQPLKLSTKSLKYILVGLVFFASLSSIAVAGKTFFNGQKSGYNIVAVSKSFENIFRERDQEYIILGPTEIWPFINNDRNVLIIDNTRDPKKNLPKLQPIINSLDYIVINKNYTEYGWEQEFLRHYPGYDFEQVKHVGGQKEFIKISRLKKK
jgi:hypothetical protein